MSSPYRLYSVTTTIPIAISSGGTGTSSSTGTGTLVLSVSPDLVTPVIGVASGTSLGLSGSLISGTVFLNRQSVSSEGSYLDWDVVAGNKTVFRNNRGSVAVGGWAWEGFSNTSEGMAMNLSHAGVLKLDKMTPSTSLALDGSRNVVSVANTGAGSNVLATSPSLITPVMSSPTINGSVTLSALTANTLLGLDGSKAIVSVSTTGTGDLVHNISPALVTPIIGVASGISLGLIGSLSSGSVFLNKQSVSSEGSYLDWDVVAGNKTVFRNNRGAVSVGGWAWEGFSNTSEGMAMNLSHAGVLKLDKMTPSTSLALDGSRNVVSVANTGAGSNVLATSPSLITPVMSSPTINGSVTLSALSANTLLGLDGSKAIVSLPTTGTGDLVQNISPALVTPIIGVASGTSLGLIGSLISGSVFLNRQSVSSEGSYMDWDVAGNKTVFRNNRGSVSVGGWAWEGFSNTSEGMAMNLSHAGVLKLDKMTPSTSLALDGSRNVVSVANTGAGSNVLATSPTLTSPALITPDIGTATGTALKSNIGDLNLGSHTSQAVVIGGTTTPTDLSSTFFKIQKPGSGAVMFVANTQTGNTDQDYFTFTCKNIFFQGGRLIGTMPSNVMTFDTLDTISHTATNILATAMLANNTVSYEYGRDSGAGNSVDQKFLYMGNNNASNTFAIAFKGKGANVIFNNDSVVSTTFNGPIETPYAQAVQPAVVSGQGSYMSWNDGSGDGSTYFKTQRGGGVGGWKWQSYDNLDVLTGTSMTLSSAGVLDFPNTVSGTFTPAFYWISGFNERVPLTLASGSLTGTYKRVGDVVYCSVYCNCSANALFQGAAGQVGWIGDFPKFGRNIVVSSIQSVPIDPGSERWPLVTSPNQIVLSIDAPGKSLGGTDGGSTCFYADTTILVFDALPGNSTFILRYTTMYFLS